MINFDEIKSEYPFNTNVIQVKSYNYHYLDEGGRDKEVLLMVHGSPSWSFMYRNLFNEFNKEYRVIAPDHLGCGLSDKPQDFPYRLETHIDNLEALVLSLQLDRITLVMHDWGAAIAMGFAIRHPHRIARLVVLNSAAFSMTWLPLRLSILRIPWLNEKLVRNFNLYINAYLAMSSRRGLPPIVKNGFKFPYQTFEDRVAIFRFLQDIPIDTEHVSYEVLLEIEHALWMFRESPACIIWGMKDWCFSQRYLKRWCLFYPQAEVHKLEEAGHFLLEDECIKTAEFIKKFLRNSPVNSEI